MKHSVSNIDWGESTAHLLFLSKFLSIQPINRYSHSIEWQKVLGESPEQVIKKFLGANVLEFGSLPELLTQKYGVSDLKSLLKQRNLPTSGKKADLVTRLIQVDPDGMKQEVSDLQVVRCSEFGRVVVGQYLNQEKEKRTKVEQQMSSFLKNRRFKEASQLMAAYEAKQVFPRGINIDWKHYAPSQDIELLNIMFNGKPKIFERLSGEILDTLRLAAAMMHLWGKNTAKDWLPLDLETGLAIDNDSAVRMMISYANHQQRIISYRAMGIKKVEVRTCNDSLVCESCQKLAQKQYSIDQMPELPYEKCTSEMGCRCLVVGMII